ncbi:MAG: 2,3-butanediol dehydrogenase [Deltaproteobacteria bacterium]|nr:2,3-butanediol dehydrogenase [Deltaproteobacteria bacterium]
MKAAVWHEKGDIRIEESPLPSPGPGQVKVKVKVCGICGSDLHEFREGPFIIPARPHPLTGRQGGPVILGHEFSAEVVEIGESVTRFSPGDRVVVNPLIYCGECHYCKVGQHIMCTKLGTVGFAADGGFAEYGVFQEYALLKLPDTVTDEMGAFVEPLAVALHAVNRAGMKAGDSVAVVGAGPIGLLVMQACLAAGAAKVFVVEPVKTRREIASETGAAAIIDPSETDPGKEIGVLTEGLRADLALDCVGSQSSFDTAVRVTGRRGTICIVGLALKHEKEITFSSGYENEFPAAIAYLGDGRVKVNRLISEAIRLDDLVEKGIRPLIQEGEKHIKILVYP